MTRTFLYLLSLLNLTIHQANCATVEYVITINKKNLELNCTYTLAKDEILYQVILKKDTDTFVKFDQDNKNGKYQNAFYLDFR